MESEREMARKESEIIEYFLGEKESDATSDLIIAREYIEEAKEKYESLIAHFDEEKPNEDATKLFLQYSQRRIEKLDEMICEIEETVEQIMHGE